MRLGGEEPRSRVPGRHRRAEGGERRVRQAEADEPRRHRGPRRIVRRRLPEEVGRGQHGSGVGGGADPGGVGLPEHADRERGEAVGGLRQVAHGGPRLGDGVGQRRLAGEGLRRGAGAAPSPPGRRGIAAPRRGGR